eukprot:TRINITY_DN5096_c0_g1_i3.p1 TRINITY_DN5096_c0_g1~~TRINITY_DN5096_c0_g1_i3.p1  ORF type:complete len:296 (+),score=58.30 TRINITY_DN5096_c0_g1_i3:1083-1970(+)
MMRKFRTNNIIPLIQHKYGLQCLTTLHSHTPSLLTFARTFSSLPDSNPVQTSTQTTPEKSNNETNQIINNANNEPTPNTIQERGGIFSKIFCFFFTDPTMRFVVASKLYESCKAQAERPEFLEYWNLDNNFRSWFVLNLLHVWMCMVGLRVYEREGNRISQRLFEIFWEEAERRLVHVENVKNPMILSKNLNIFYRQYHGSVFSFDEGMISSDMVLADALWRNVFGMGEQFDKNKKLSLDEKAIEIEYKKDDLAAQRLFSAVEYVRRELQFLELSREHTIEGIVKWGDPINPVKK